MIMQTILKRILTDLKAGEVEGYLAIVFAVSAFVIGLLDTQVALNISIQVIAAVLALLAVSIIRNKTATQSLNDTIERVQKNLVKSGQLHFRGDLQAEIQNLITEAKSDVNIVVPIGKSIENFYTEMQVSLDRGCQFRIVQCSQEMSELLAFRSPNLSIASPEDAKMNLKNIENKFKGLATYNSSTN